MNNQERGWGNIVKIQRREEQAHLKRRVKQEAERKKTGKLNFIAFQKNDDIKVGKEAGLYLQGKKVIMEKKVAKKSREKLQ